MMRYRTLAPRRNTMFAVVLALALSTLVGCDLNGEVSKRFREAFIPGLTAGLTTAATNPANGETGLRQTLVALIDGLGALLQPSSTSSSTSGS